MTQNFAEIFSKFRVHLSQISVKRNFTGAKIRACEISGKRKFADTAYNANRLNLIRTLKPALECIALNHYTVR